MISAANLGHLPLKTKGFGTERVFRAQAVRAAPGVLPWSCSSSLGPTAAAAAPSRLLSAFLSLSLSLSRGCAVEAARKAKPQAVGLAGFSIAKSTSGASLLCAFGSGGVSTTSRQTCRIPILARTARNGGRRCSCLGDTSCCLVVLCLDLRIAALRLRPLHHWHRLLPRRLCQSCPATGERAHEGVRTMPSFVSDLPSLRVVAQIPQTERASLKGAPLVSHSWMQCR